MAVHQPQHGLVEALDADRDPVHAVVAHDADPLGAFVAEEVVRVDVVAELGAGVQIDALVEADQEALELRRGQEGRRAAADQDRARLDAVDAQPAQVEVHLLISIAAR